MKIVINFILYQLIWLICILGENKYLWFALLMIVIHFAISTKKAADLKIMVVLFVTGLAIDGSLTISGFFSFNVPALPLPAWLAILWLGLAILPHHSLNWLKGKRILSSVFGATGGPLAYWAGVRLGAAEFNYPLIPSLIILSVIWAILWPFAMHQAERISPSRIYGISDNYLQNQPATKNQGC